MEKLINGEKAVISVPSKKELEKQIPLLFKKAMTAMQTKENAIRLYKGRISYTAFENHILKYWTGKYPNGDPVTHSEEITSETFLSWVQKQDYKTQQQIYKNLVIYTRTNVSTNN